MNIARKKMLQELFGRPDTLYPAYISVASLLISWALQGVGFLNLIGFCAAAIAAGTFFTRLAIDGKTLMEKQKSFEKDESLDALDEDLKEDRDARVRACLFEIREMCEGIDNIIKESNIVGGEAITQTVHELFDDCIIQLRESHRLAESAKSMMGDAKKRIKEKREKKVLECVETVNHLREVIEKVHMLRADSESRSEKLREKLDRQIEVAQEIGNESKLSALEEEYDEFMKHKETE